MTAPSHERFERCFREHYAEVLAFALRRISDRANGEDVAAEAFSIAWRRREAIPEQPLSWLYGVTVRVIANQRRAGGRRRNLEQRLMREGAGWIDRDDPGAALMRRTVFSEAFARLAESEREVLRLVAWEGLDAGDAAEVLGCTAGAFRVRLFRARRKLAREMAAAEGAESITPSTDPVEESQ
jgi:RNA polymerase sigma factor (sigma-70 family)